MNDKVQNSAAVNPAVIKAGMPEQIYVDGVNSLVFNAAVAKLDLFTLVTDLAGRETRMVEKTLVMPSSQLFEMCKNVMLQLQATESQMKQALDQHRNNVLSSIPSSGSPTETKSASSD